MLRFSAGLQYLRQACWELGKVAALCRNQSCFCADDAVPQAAVQALREPAAEPGVHAELSGVLLHGGRGLLPARRPQHAPAHAWGPQPPGPTHPPASPGLHLNNIMHNLQSNTQHFAVQLAAEYNSGSLMGSAVPLKFTPVSSSLLDRAFLSHHPCLLQLTAQWLQGQQMGSKFSLMKSRLTFLPWCSSRGSSRVCGGRAAGSALVRGLMHMEHRIMGQLHLPERMSWKTVSEPDVHACTQMMDDRCMSMPLPPLLEPQMYLAPIRTSLKSATASPKPSPSRPSGIRKVPPIPSCVNASRTG